MEDVLEKVKNWLSLKKEPNTQTSAAGDQNPPKVPTAVGSLGEHSASEPFNDAPVKGPQEVSQTAPIEGVENPSKQ